MFARPKNRRRPSEARPRLPLINWRYLGLWVGALAGIAAAVCVVSWALDQPIETLPWVDAVSVHRAWPRGLNVRVIEQTASARWCERGLRNTRGELFDSDE